MRFQGYAVAIVLAASALASQARADKAMLVFDASGSMWGQVDDRAKIEVARQVVHDLVKDWPGTTELGLMAYGHREKGNCEDIQTLVPVGPIDGPAIRDAIDGVDPKGKTPISAAVRRAARELRSEEGKATVILVSDGLETCNEDPCAVARELEKSGVDFTVHVVGFGTSEDENQQLRCLADITGGRFLRARNASELKQAMSQTVELVKKPTVVNARKVVTNTGSLSVDGPLFSADVIDRRGATIETVRVHGGSVVLPAGIYSLKTSAAVQFDGIEVRAGEKTVFDGRPVAGFLAVDSILVPADVFDREGAKIETVWTGGGFVVLPIGTYTLKSRAVEIKDVEIKPGEETVVRAED